MTILQAQDWYHTAVIVPDVEEAMARLTHLAGHEWMMPVEHPVQVWSADGEATATLRMVYSHGEPGDPRLELIQEVPGSPWVRSPQSAIHHIGYFVDDLQASSQALVDEGVPLEVCGCMGPTRPTGFAYHLTPEGLRIEVVRRTVLQEMQQLMEQQGR
jgi:catechol 2,3-dioxygenase-like lactoylglutathione lyase family enzyme